MNFLFYLWLVIGCSMGDDYYIWDAEIAESGVVFDISLVGEPTVLVHKNLTLCDGLENMESNNNVAAKLFQGRLFVAWRTAPVHFASRETKLHIASSVDFGETWDFENTIFLGSDLREPLFVEAEGRLFFYFFQGGTNPLDFEPRGLFRMERMATGVWSDPEVFGHEGEVIWEIVEHNGTLFSQSYSGNYSTPGDAEDLGQLTLFFNRSQNGLDWEPVGRDSVYSGGLTEVGFGFGLDGRLWGVGRNEDGDQSGWGSRLFTAPTENLSAWTFLEQDSNPWIYESPKMFRHGSELYLVARTDPDGPFWSRDDPALNTLPAWEHHLYDLVSYSFRQHGTGIWRLDQGTGDLVKVVDLVGCGDTALPSLVRVSEHKYIIFNYSSAVEEEHCPPNWIMGQVSPAGSIIYAQEIEFLPQE